MNSNERAHKACEVRLSSILRRPYGLKQDVLSRVIDPDNQKRRIGYICRDRKCFSCIGSLVSTDIESLLVSFAFVFEQELPSNQYNGYIFHELNVLNKCLFLKK